MPRTRQNKDANVSFFAFQDIITSVTGILILIVILMVLMLRQPGVVEKIQTDPVETRTVEEVESLIAEALKKVRELALLDLPGADETEASVRASIEELEAQVEAETDPLRAALLADVESAAAELKTLEENHSDLVEKQASLEGSLKEAKETVIERTSIVDESKIGDQIWLQMDPSDKDPIIVELDHQGGVLRDRNAPDIFRKIPSVNLVADLRRIAENIDGLESYFVFFIRPSGTEFLAPLQKMLQEEGIDLGFRPLGEGVELKIYDPEAEVFEE